MVQPDLMAGDFFISTLYHKAVATKKGKFMGIIENVLLNTENGRLISLLVKPSDELDLKRFNTDENGLITIPFDMVAGVQDMVILNLTL